MGIKTFVFFDMETTGLPHLEYFKTKIMELSLVAVQSDHIELGVFPRVQNKLSMCFNPNKLISPEASKITGLYNDLLEYQPTFKSENIQILQNFLKLQREPICFVAHNGNSFDYPILKAELHHNKISLPETILCIDSLEAFRELCTVTDNANVNKGKENVSQEELTHSHSVKDKKHTQSVKEKVPFEFTSGFNEFLVNLAEDEPAKNAQVVNETTPKKPTHFNLRNEDVGGDGPCVRDAYYVPEDERYNEKQVSCKVRIIDGNHQSSDVRSISNTSSLPSTSKKHLTFWPKGFKLTEVYKRLTTKDPINAHNAEHDVNMMIECAAVLGEQFTAWANENAKKFSDIPMMTPGRKLGT